MSADAESTLHAWACGKASLKVGPEEEAPMTATFQEAFCRMCGCPAEVYAREVFRRCLYRHALPLAAILRRVAPEVFQEDFDLIREVGAMTDPETITREINYFYGRNVRDKSWIRRWLLVRVSGKRLLRLKNHVFARSARVLEL